MYQLISTINYFIRENIMPNPFEFISENSLIVMTFSAIIGSKILHKLAFNMCGIFYTKGEAPTLGSILYMIFFSLNAGLLILIGRIFKEITIIITVYAISIAIFYIILTKIKNKMYFG